MAGRVPSHRLPAPCRLLVLAAGASYAVAAGSGIPSQGEGAETRGGARIPGRPRSTFF